MKIALSFRVRLFALAMAGVGWLVPAAYAQSPTAITSGGLDLQTTLQKGLKARRPVEFQFIAMVSQMVENGQLDQGTVIQALLYARQKRTPYPYVYFCQSLQYLAPQVGSGLF